MAVWYYVAMYGWLFLCLWLVQDGEPPPPPPDAECVAYTDGSAPTGDCDEASGGGGGGGW